MFQLKCFSFLFLINVIYCGNILFLDGLLSPSHHMWNNVLIKGLAKTGHNITVVTVEDDKSTANIHYIVMEATYKSVYGENNSFNILDFVQYSTPFTSTLMAYSYYDTICDGILDSKGLDIILNYPNDFKFDTVIYDFTVGPCLLPLLHKFNYPPLISVTAFSNPPYTIHLIGGSKHPAYVPHYNVNYPQLMSFPQRLFNNFLYFMDTLSRQYIIIPTIERKVRERFNFKDFPSLIELEQKTAIMFVNTDSSMDHQEPIQPNMIRVGGLQIQEPKELPKEMLEFIKSGKRGTILMSLGTNIKSNMLGNERLTAIVNTFAQLNKYNFIWKFESEPHELPVAPPKNVFISKFLPQNDILAHPSVIAFITHAGLLSTQEALWYGKPMLAIPFFVDQFRTAGKIEMIEAGVVLDYKTLNVENFRRSILETVSISKYSQNAKQISRLFQDRPKRPLDEALWWVEYVIRNPTGPQYESPSLKMGWFAANSYDVTLTVFISVLILLYIFFKIVKIFFKFFKIFEDKKLKTN